MDYSHHHEGTYSQANDTQPQVRQRRVDVDGDDHVDHSNAGCVFFGRNKFNWFHNCHVFIVSECTRSWSDFEVWLM